MTTANDIKIAMQSLHPSYIELVNESINHAGYFEGKESHFKLTIVSEVFTNKRLVARHQMVFKLVHDLLTAQGGTIHALAIHAYTADEWQAQGVSPNSPQCAGQRKV